MPHADLPDRPRRRALAGRSFTPGFGPISWTPSKRRRDDGSLPVKPDRPLGLSGGGAAELDFES